MDGIGVKLMPSLHSREVEKLKKILYNGSKFLRR